jgi:predicted phosphodiesterase
MQLALISDTHIPTRESEIPERFCDRIEAADHTVHVGGHTHQVEDTVHENVRLLNPGSVTGAAPAEEATMITVDVEDGAIDVTVHEA